jgi:drug/metabolite transporter (DMT)-like permease
VSTIRRLLLAVVVLGMTGTLTDLLLLAHYEDTFQLIPVGLLVAALVVVFVHLVHQRRASVRALQAVMLLCVAAGLIGIGLHFNGAAEFQLEIDPSLDWRGLIRKVSGSQSPPLLAPGAMVQLGVIGLIYAFRHPATAPAGEGFEETNE